ncbi:hypothetical protein ACLIYP_01190 [Streptomyces nanhaiensis]|uniref:hypothetical protein n=1 Tax=Streptomyces nanhaiensis TaxID=679319 RepID=UPI00399C73C3
MRQIPPGEQLDTQSLIALIRTNLTLAFILLLALLVVGPPMAKLMARETAAFWSPRIMAGRRRLVRLLAPKDDGSPSTPPNRKI